jgi:iron-only hydrogenase maturation protein HydE
MRDLINELYQEQTLSKANLINLLLHINDEEREYLYEKAYSVRYEHYKNSVYVRGLIEFSNYCKNDCTYCGISIHNKELTRYHMTPEEVIKTAEIGYSLGFRTFVMQGGEDTSFTDDKFAAIISSIKTQFPEAAVTLSIGERSKESYQKLYDAGADRFLIRHETINKKLYEKAPSKNVL